MRQKKFHLPLVCILMIGLTGTQLLRPESVQAFDGEAWAIRGGRIVTVTGATIEKGTIVIRNGLIESVGADVQIPGDARIIDATGMTIYPGLFDSYTTYGIRPPAPQGAAGRRGGPGVDPVPNFLAQLAAPPSDEGLKPEVSVVEQLQIAENTFDQQRAVGITTALTAPRTGIFQGQSALINLGKVGPEKLILKTPYSLNVSFSGARGRYPGSLMGVFAYLRQMLSDARHYKEEWARYEKSPRGAKRPEINASLAALQPVIDGKMPVIFSVSSEREMRRVISLAEEFKLNYILAGATQSYLNADYLKSKNATVLLSLNYPQKPQLIEDPEMESLSTLRERAEAPKAAAALQKSGVNFAFQSGGLTRPQDYLANARRAIEAGLPKDEAIKALTIYPARIFGVGEQLGSIEKGKIANLVLASGDIFDSNTKVKHVLIDGEVFEIKAPPAAPGGAGRGGPGRGAAPGGGAAAMASGRWMLNVNSPNGNVEATLSLSQSGSGLTGEIQTPFGPASISNGRVEGNNVTFSYSLNVQGQQLEVTARGKIDGNSISGTMEAGGQSFDFTGMRRPN
ncbi:MAG: amidohydrolase family protein [Acidobacteriota bacterium]|nr:MAG: amidohydrolase family protein [Acidobacteriota bacterium]